MPFVRASRLRDRLRREAQLPLDDAVRITRDVAGALDHAHSAGVVHRDIKPENILLSGGQALVADFGIARALDGAGEGDPHRTGLALGTPAYMGPNRPAASKARWAADHLRARLRALRNARRRAALLRGWASRDHRQAAGRPRAVAPHSTARRAGGAGRGASAGAVAQVPPARFATIREFAQHLTTPFSSSPPRRRAFPIAAAVAALAVAVGLAVWLSRSRPAASLDPDVIAVAPFEVLAPDLDLWREGLVDLLSRQLDGAGPLRTVSPTTIVRRASGKADRSSAERLARNTGAGLAVYGAIVGAGPDSVRLTATVLDVGRDQIVSETELRGSAGRMDQLADSVALRVLRDLGRNRPIGATRSSGFGSRSLPALRAFLRGEQHFRRTEWDSARVSYEQAIGEDTAFALAYWRLGEVRGWTYGNDSLAQAFHQRAGRLNHGLAPRESLLVVCDSLWGGIQEDFAVDSADQEHLDRLFRSAEVLTQRYPLDPEGWVALGEARFHFGHGRGVTPQMSREAFDQAITLDSAYAPAHIHAVDLALMLDDPVAARRDAARLLALRPGGEPALTMRAALRLLQGPASETEIDRLLDSLSPLALFHLSATFLHAVDASELTIRVHRKMAEREISQDAFHRERAVRVRVLALLLAQRGHIREAYDLLGATDMSTGSYLLAELALLGIVPPDTADLRYRHALNQAPISPMGTLGSAPAWWYARRDSASLKLYAQRLKAGAGAQAQPQRATPEVVRYRLASVDAYLAALRADTAAAIARLRERSPILIGASFERLALIRLLSATGRKREALAELDRGFPWPYASLTRGLWALEHARLADRLGENEKARERYGYVAKIWRHGDPELRVDPLRGWPCRSARRGCRPSPWPGRPSASSASSWSSARSGG